MNRLVRLLVPILTVVVSVGLAIACQAAPGRTSTITLITESDSGVTGTMTLSELSNGKTRLAIDVEPNGQLDMPAHVHAGVCGDLIPQPKFPLENVRNGRSVTEVPATFAELTDGSLAINLHRSVDELKVSTACAELR